MKYCIYNYPGLTANLGNNIQTLAAMQFLPKVDERLLWGGSVKKSKEKKFIIANGFYFPRQNDFSFPGNITPFYTSVFIHEADWLNKNQVSHLKEHEPIGCRDEHTLKSLMSKGILAYYSKCLTLTLKNKFNYRSNKIYFVDVDKENLKKGPREFKDLVNKSTPITHLLKSSDMSDLEERFQCRQKRAQELLDAYATAKSVITSRLHCALPCIAFKTPVLFVTKNPDNTRFTIDLLKKITINNILRKEREGGGNFIMSPPDIESDADILRRLCIKAVKKQDNPLKEYKEEFKKEKSKIWTLQDIDKIL